MSEPSPERTQRQTRRIGEDRWFDAQLNQLFLNVVSEPLPADLADLIQQLKSEDSGRQDTDSD